METRRRVERWILRDKLLWKSLWVQLELRPGWARWGAECDEDMRDGDVRTGNERQAITC